MAAGKRISFTVPPDSLKRLSRILSSMVEEGAAITDILAVAVQAFLIGLLALELLRRPEGPPDGVKKLVRTALDPDVGAPQPLNLDSPKPETPAQRGWRTWRDAFLRVYGRTYTDHAPCGKAMISYAKSAVANCERTGHFEDADLESMFVHWWKAYLRDTGRSAGAGDPGYNISHSHALVGFDYALQTYGTPWDRETKSVMRKELTAPVGPRQLVARTPCQRALLDINTGVAEALKATKGRSL